MHIHAHTDLQKKNICEACRKVFLQRLFSKSIQINPAKHLMLLKCLKKFPVEVIYQWFCFLEMKFCWNTEYNNEFLFKVSWSSAFLYHKRNFVHDSLSRISEIQFSTLAYSELWAKLQSEREALKAILNSKVEVCWKLAKIQMVDVKSLFNCEIFGKINMPSRFLGEAYLSQYMDCCIPK